MFVRFASARRAARWSLLALGIAIVAAPARAGFTPFSIAGTTVAASIAPTIDLFKQAIGGGNNANAGTTVGGRREINWDGGGAITAAVSLGPVTAFTNTRGATFTNPSLAPDSGFLQTPLNVSEFTNLDPSYQTTFATFSPVRIFTPTGSNITNITFSVPGTAGATPATVSAFGAIFSDVDLASTTKIEFFDLANASLFLLNVLPGAASTAPNGALSFAGAVADAGEKIARITITTGNQALDLPDSNGDPVDVVVMDDFLYAEPVAVPEPASIALIATVLIAWRRLASRRT